jgi:hypothetical protein
MGRKLTEEELDDPDFQALFVALEKVSKPIRAILTEIRNRDAALAAPETAQHSDESSPQPA